MIVAATPGGFTANDAAAAVPLTFERLGPDGSIVVDDPDGGHRLWLATPKANPAAIVIPLDIDFELRTGVALRLFRRLTGRPAGPLPARLRITPFQRLRLILLLQVFDRLRTGASKREIAEDVIYSRLPSLSNAEWKGSAERRRTQRLCDEARAMVAAGYRRLLRGR